MYHQTSTTTVQRHRPLSETHEYDEVLDHRTSYLDTGVSLKQCSIDSANELSFSLASSPTEENADFTLILRPPCLEIFFSFSPRLLDCFSFLSRRVAFTSSNINCSSFHVDLRCPKLKFFCYPRFGHGRLAYCLKPLALDGGSTS